jgi:hypothetical protein
VEQTNVLGIHLSRDRLCAVVLKGRTSDAEVLASFSVDTEVGHEHPQEAVSPAAALAQKLADERITCDEITVSLDCAFYTQHELRSEFSDVRQIANTIAFDAEEALGRDATQMAITFNVTASGENGSNVTVFTSERKLLEDILANLQREDLDPISVEPDIVCLARYLDETVTLPDESNPVFVVIGDDACYIINLRQGHDPLVRSFILSKSQDMTRILRREIPLTIASMNLSGKVNSVFITGRCDTVDIETLSEKIGIETSRLKPARELERITARAEENASLSAFTAACGAAMGQMKRVKPKDFRRSFAPYQGKRLLLQKSLRTISVFVTISLVVLGAFFQLKVFRVNNYISRFETKLAKDYMAVTYGKKPDLRKAVAAQLETELKKLEKIKQGQGFGDESSVSAKLTYVLEGITDAPKNVDVNVSGINITRTVSIAGDTNSRASTLALLQSFKDKGKLEKTRERWGSDQNRDKFEFFFELKR